MSSFIEKNNIRTNKYYAFKFIFDKCINHSSISIDSIINKYSSEIPKDILVLLKNDFLSFRNNLFKFVSRFRVFRFYNDIVFSKDFKNFLIELNDNDFDSLLEF